jgi:peptidoglycan/xylan/chitin deacetylase (PgdA/CDA1 family)
MPKIKSGPFVGPGGNRKSWSSYWNAQYFQDGETFDNGKVVLQFDDGYIDNYTNGLPVFLDKNVPVTVFCNTSFIGTAGAMTWANVLEMKNAGMDMQSHSDGLTDSPPWASADVATNLEAENVKFIAGGLSSPTQFAYPGGNFDDDYIGGLVQKRLIGRTTNSNLSDRTINRKSPKYLLGGITYDSGVDAVKTAIDLAKANNTAVIVWGHQIGTGTASSVSIADFEEIVDYGKSIGVDFITTSQLYELMFYIDIHLSRPIATPNKITVICKNRCKTGDSISIERSDDNGANYTEITTLNYPNYTYDDEGLTLNTSYKYRARGFKGTHYLPYSRVAQCSTECTLTVTASGTGAGVASFNLLAREPILLTIDGNGKFYTNSAGTEGESTEVLIHKFNTIYIKVTSGESTLKFSKNKVYKIGAWTSGTNAPVLGGDITIFRELEYFDIQGNNTISGDVSKLVNLNYIYTLGSNTLSGDISALTNLTYVFLGGASNTIAVTLTNLVNLTYFKAAGANTVGGSISNLVSLTHLEISLANTVSGSINSLTSLDYLRLGAGNTISGNVALCPLLTYLYVAGANTLSGSFEGLTNLTYLRIESNNARVAGDLKVISSKLTLCWLNQCAVVDYTSGGNWGSISAAGYIYVLPATGFGLASAEVDLLLQEIAATKVAGRAVNVNLTGSNAARTSASDEARATILTDGGAVTTNP